MEPNRGEGKKCPCLINIPTAQFPVIEAAPPPFLLILFFLIFAPALGSYSFHPCSPLLLQRFFCFQASSQSPLDSVSKQFGRKNECKAGAGAGVAQCVCVGGVGGRDKATSVSDTNMAQSQHQYYVYAPSFSASHRVTDPPAPLPLALPPSLLPSKSVLSLHSASQSCYFGLKRQWFGLMGLCFPLVLPCLAQWGGGRWELFEWF